MPEASQWQGHDINLTKRLLQNDYYHSDKCDIWYILNEHYKQLRVCKVILYLLL